MRFSFEEAGIPFVRKQVMAHVPGLEKDSALETEHVKSIGAAAAGAADDQPESGKKPGQAESVFKAASARTGSTV